jgi:hypothetical protein
MPAMPGVRSLSSVTMRWASFGPTPGVRATWARSAWAILHCHQGPKPASLGGGGEAVQPDHVLAHMGLDEEARRLAGLRQRRERARRAHHEIADPTDIEDDMILAELLDEAFQFADHPPTFP